MPREESVDNALNKLHKEYTLLSGVPLDQLSDDQIRSLQYYQAATQPTTETTRAKHWVDNAARLEGFVQENSRMPRENSRKRWSIPPTERSLADWVRYQRRIEEKLCDYQARRLEAVRGFSWDPRARASNRI